MRRPATSTAETAAPAVAHTSSAATSAAPCGTAPAAPAWAEVAITAELPPTSPPRNQCARAFGVVTGGTLPGWGQAKMPEPQ